MFRQLVLKRSEKESQIRQRPSGLEGNRVLVVLTAMHEGHNSSEDQRRDGKAMYVVSSLSLPLHRSPLNKTIT